MHTILNCLDSIWTTYNCLLLYYQQRPQVLAQYPLGLLDDVFFIQDEEQCPQPFSCEQLFLPGETSLQVPLLLLLLLLGERGEEPFWEGLLAFGEDGAGPSKALTCRHDVAS